MYPYGTFRKIMHQARAVMGLEERRADPGAFTAYLLLASQAAADAIRAAGYHVDAVEVEGFDQGQPEFVAYVHGTPVVAVAV